MKTSFRWLFGSALVGAALGGLTDVAIAQSSAGSSSSSTNPVGTTARAGASKVASQELRSIYQQDVGQGFSSSSLNQISMANARSQVGYYGQGTFGTQRASTPSSMGSSMTPSLGPARNKPFSSVGSSPTVSPYMNLFRDDFEGGGDFNYQTLVRPQFQQMATNQQFQRQSNELAQRVQSISARGAYQNPAGSEAQYPTGHQTAFGWYSRFYPGMPQPRGR